MPQSGEHQAPLAQQAAAVTARLMSSGSTGSAAVNPSSSSSRNTTNSTRWRFRRVPTALSISSALMVSANSVKTTISERRLSALARVERPSV